MMEKVVVVVQLKNAAQLFEKMLMRMIVILVLLPVTTLVRKLADLLMYFFRKQLDAFICL
jgi:hypothetical protein